MPADAIKQIDIYTYRRARDVIGSEREKWRPASRETADHSMPYIVSAVLVDGHFSDAIFEPKRFRDPRILDLIDKTNVLEDAALTERFPKALPCRIEITTNDGERHVEENEYPLGHVQNPMSDLDIEAKFRNLAVRALTKSQMDTALQVMWQLERQPNLEDLFAALVVGPAPQ